MGKLDYFGVRSCGCITAWMSGDHTSRAEVRDFYRDMADTGREVRRGDLEDFRDKPEFAPEECPHTAAASDDGNLLHAAGFRAKEQHRDD